MAYLAYYLHWPFQEILDLEHTERRRWVEEVGRINLHLSEALVQGAE